MKSKKSYIVLINSFVGGASQVIKIILDFAVRMLVLRYIGVEILGISSTLSSLLSTLALSELGFQSAIVYKLYIPIKKDDREKICKILTVLKYVYYAIAAIFLLSPIVVIPFLGVLLNGVNVDRNVIVFFVLLSFDNALSYFFAYKRTLIFAYQREYVCKGIDIASHILIAVLKIVAIIYTRNYMFVLLLQVTETFISNVLIRLYCKKEFPYLHKTRFDRGIFHSVFQDVKNIFGGKIAGYVYSSTDNIIISSLIGTIQVGLVTNYSTIITSVKSIINAMFAAMTPIIGNLLLDDNVNQNEYFSVYTYIRYLIAGIIILPLLVLFQDVICLMYGEEYLLSNVVVYLLLLDLYVHMVYSPCCEYINANGLFKIDKYIAYIGVALNLLSSIILVFKYGIAGVLCGTVISQLFFWGARSGIVYRFIFKKGIVAHLKYLFKQMTWLLIVISVFVISVIFKSKLTISNEYLKLAGLCVAVEMIFIVIQLFFCAFYNEARDFWRKFFEFVKNKL